MEQVRRGIGDVLSGVVAVAIAVAGFVSLGANATFTQYDFGTDPGPALLPRILLWALAAGGAWLVLSGGWKVAGAGGLAAIGPAVRGGALRRFAVPAAFLGSLLVYLRAMVAVGFPAATVVFTAVWIAVLTRSLDRRLTLRHAVVAAVASAAITAGVYYVFEGFVKVPLP